MFSINVYVPFLHLQRVQRILCSSASAESPSCRTHLDSLPWLWHDVWRCSTWRLWLASTRKYANIGYSGMCICIYYRGIELTRIEFQCHLATYGFNGNSQERVCLNSITHILPSSWQIFRRSFSKKKHRADFGMSQLFGAQTLYLGCDAHRLIDPFWKMTLASCWFASSHQTWRAGKFLS